MEAITISLDIYPGKGKQPATVNVGAAAGDGTPFLLTGTFAERHQLVDQAYGLALKQKAKAEARAESKATKAKPGKAKATGGKAKDVSVKSGEEPEGDPENEFPPREPDHAGALARSAGPVEETHAGTQTPVVQPADDLPVIEGDDGEMELELEGGTDG